jgi:hypothetical protein
LSLRGTRTQYSKDSENEFSWRPDNTSVPLLLVLQLERVPATVTGYG